MECHGGFHQWRRPCAPGGLIAVATAPLVALSRKVEEGSPSSHGHAISWGVPRKRVSQSDIGVTKADNGTAGWTPEALSKSDSRCVSEGCPMDQGRAREYPLHNGLRNVNNRLDRN